MKLPEPKYPTATDLDGHYFDAFTADQMKEAYKQGLEDAAKACDEQATDPDEADNKPWTDCAEYLAHSIRELGETE